MAKRVDISEKLQFDEDPVLVINGEEIEVNSGAETALRLMGIMSGPRTMVNVVGALEIMFGEENTQKICSMTDASGKKLKVESLMTIMEQGISLIMGTSEGE